jgi:hypothetical protein
LIWAGGEARHTRAETSPIAMDWREAMNDGWLQSLEQRGREPTYRAKREGWPNAGKHSSTSSAARLIAAALVTAGATAPKWKAVTRRHGSLFSYDEASLSRSGSRISFWASQQTGRHIARNRIIIDCAKQTWALTASIQPGSGGSMSTEQYPASFSPIGAEDSVRPFHTALCRIPRR